MPELDRRDFLKLVGVGAGAAAAASCSDPVEKLIPRAGCGNADRPTGARALANELVQQINAMGLPAQRAWGAPNYWGNSLLIEGQFISINQGNRTERTVIGLGFGASQVQTQVQVYETRSWGLERVLDFITDARSGYKPGMAETMGAGAAAGSLAVSAAVSVAGTVASEMLSANVKADAERTAKDVANQLQAYFARQGWVPYP